MHPGLTSRPTLRCTAAAETLSGEEQSTAYANGSAHLWPLPCVSTLGQGSDFQSLWFAPWPFSFPITLLVLNPHWRFFSCLPFRAFPPQHRSLHSSSIDRNSFITQIGVQAVHLIPWIWVHNSKILFSEYLLIYTTVSLTIIFILYVYLG